MLSDCGTSWQVCRAYFGEYSPWTGNIGGWLACLNERIVTIGRQARRKIECVLWGRRVDASEGRSALFPLRIERLPPAPELPRMQQVCFPIAPGIRVADNDARDFERSDPHKLHAARRSRLETNASVAEIGRRSAVEFLLLPEVSAPWPLCDAGAHILTQPSRRLPPRPLVPVWV